MCRQPTCFCLRRKLPLSVLMFRRPCAGVEHLIVAQDESGTPVGFMGVQENRLEMLFLDPEARGQGLGARLLCLGMEQYGVSELTVNEQNPAAAGFYRHIGFAVYRRSELDEQGGPYPILYMRRG